MPGEKLIVILTDLLYGFGTQLQMIKYNSKKICWMLLIFIHYNLNNKNYFVFPETLISNCKFTDNRAPAACLTCSQHWGSNSASTRVGPTCLANATHPVKIICLWNHTHTHKWASIGHNYRKKDILRIRNEPLFIIRSLD